jgi:outer membrane lipoprotein-sorting protein
MSKIVSKLFLISVIFLLFSCARPRVEMPSYEGVDVKDVLTAKNNISTIETTFSISFEKDDTEIRGDGVLNIAKNGDLSMRIYSFGFLAFEMTSENGAIKSRPAVDRNKGTLLTYGLRDCLFWWDLDNFDTEEKEDVYILRDLNKTLWMDKKTMLPRKMSISLEEGRELNVSYENPEKMGDMWYPSKIRIELSKYAVTLKIRDISFALNAT